MDVGPRPLLRVAFSPETQLVTGPVTGRRNLGFTLVELLMVVTILGIIVSIAIPQYGKVREKAMIARAIGDVDALGWDVMEYELRHGEFPNSLSAIGRGGYEDPWGNPYRYLRIKGGSGGAGAQRKDRFLVPVNSDFDLYSMGPDGKTSAPFTAASAQDDIVRANDGGFVGIAGNF
jgi:general secretion pathway protein G